MSDTPRTDERKASFALDTIRQLETELTAVTEQLKAAQDGWHDEITKGLTELRRAESIYTKAQERAERAEEQRDRLADLVKQFIYILDITEESDGGRLFHPTNITSCRAGDLQKAGQLVEALRRAVKGGSDEPQG